MPTSRRDEIEIRASARRVFEVLTNAQSFVDCAPLVEKVEFIPDGPMRRGTRIRAYGPKSADRDEPIQAEAEVSEFIPPRVVEFTGAMSSDGAKNRMVSRYEIEQYGAVARLAVTTRVDREGFLLWLTAPLVRLMLSWTTTRQLRQIKAAAERLPI